MPVAGYVLGGDDELVAGVQPDRAAGELTEADLGPLQVGEDADAPAGRVQPARTRRYASRWSAW